MPKILPGRQTTKPKWKQWMKLKTGAPNIINLSKVIYFLFSVSIRISGNRSCFSIVRTYCVDMMMVVHVRGWQMSFKRFAQIFSFRLSDFAFQQRATGQSKPIYCYWIIYGNVWLLTWWSRFGFFFSAKGVGWWPLFAFRSANAELNSPNMAYWGENFKWNFSFFLDFISKIQQMQCGGYGSPQVIGYNWYLWHFKT